MGAVESAVAELMYIDDLFFIPAYAPRDQRNKFYPVVATPADLEALKGLLTHEGVPFSDDGKRGNFVCFCDLLPEMITLFGENGLILDMGAIGEDFYGEDVKDKDPIDYRRIVTPTVFDIEGKTHLVYPYGKPLYRFEYTLILDLVPGDPPDTPYLMIDDGELSSFDRFGRGIGRVEYVCEEHLNPSDLLEGLRIRKRLERTRAEMKYNAGCSGERIFIKSPNQDLGIVEAIRECPYWQPKNVLAS